MRVYYSEAADVTALQKKIYYFSTLFLLLSFTPFYFQYLLFSDHLCFMFIVECLSSLIINMASNTFRDLFRIISRISSLMELDRDVPKRAAVFAVDEQIPGKRKKLSISSTFSLVLTRFRSETLLQRKG